MSGLDDAVSLAAAKLEKATAERDRVANVVAEAVVMGDYTPGAYIFQQYRDAVTRRDAAWVAHRDALAARRREYVPSQRGSES